MTNDFLNNNTEGCEKLKSENFSCCLKKRVKLWTIRKTTKAAPDPSCEESNACQGSDADRGPKTPRSPDVAEGGEERKPKEGNPEEERDCWGRRRGVPLRTGSCFRTDLGSSPDEGRTGQLR